MPDGYQVDPGTLRSASRPVYECADALGDAAALLSAAQLVPSALGEVPAAAELASAFDRFAAAHGEDLGHGSAWVNDAAEGLVTSAEDYERRDHDAAADVTAAGS
ncbi:type VII secretion target [Actinophytocola xanthii]|uniref:ESX-1 secretion-associated protein n=1 Tax=Actinophytocola xanthii TaxID=1912961 RepID=A0A1Q8BTS5_9PSEU|nr:type VII secretion target [Actinophytocola xanthii]OLF05524.1 hypothetical protein BU204_37055 [Actinophytocola xanthii]